MEDRAQPVAQPEPYDGQDARTVFSSQKPVIMSAFKVNYRGSSSPSPQELTSTQVLESSETSSVVGVRDLSVHSDSSLCLAGYFVYCYIAHR